MRSRTSMKILIVDDSSHVHHQIKAFLASGGYHQLFFAVSAVEAFAYLGMTKDASTPTEVDLILMDIQMDGIAGIEATEAIKARSDYKHVPVLMITGEDTE